VLAAIKILVALFVWKDRRTFV